MSKEIIHLLVTAENEPNIGIIKTTLPRIANIIDINGEEILNKLKLALSDHFDCDTKDVRIESMQVKSTTPLDIEALCSIPDGGVEYEDVFVVSITKTYVY